MYEAIDRHGTTAEYEKRIKELELENKKLKHDLKVLQQHIMLMEHSMLHKNVRQ